ncbi:MAG: FecR family protein [Sandaracinaceae bacterium]
MLKQHLAPALDTEQLASGLERVERRLATTKRRRWRLAGGGVAGMAAIAAVVLLVTRAPDAPPSLMIAEGGAPPSVLPTGRTEFDDASAITLADDGALGMRQTPGEVWLELERGRARFDVTPHGPRRWTVHAGAMIVRVVGTSFTVTHDGGAASVVVHRGVVEVEVSARTRRLYAGERFGIGDGVASAGTERFGETTNVVTTIGDPNPERAADVERDTAVVGDTAAVAHDPAALDRDSVAGAGDTAAVVRDADSTPTVAARIVTAPTASPVLEPPSLAPDAVPPSHSIVDADALAAAELASVDAPESASEAAREADPDPDDDTLDPIPSVPELIARSEAARREHRLDDAAAALTAITERYPESSEAAAAAASLAGLERARGRTRAAEAAYVRALALRPPPALAELAYLELVRLTVARGDMVAARRWADRHRDTFPRGARRTAIDALLAGDR